MLLPAEPAFVNVQPLCPSLDSGGLWFLFWVIGGHRFSPFPLGYPCDSAVPADSLLDPSATSFCGSALGRAALWYVSTAPARSSLIKAPDLHLPPLLAAHGSWSRPFLAVASPAPPPYQVCLLGIGLEAFCRSLLLLQLLAFCRLLCFAVPLSARRPAANVCLRGAPLALVLSLAPVCTQAMPSPLPLPPLRPHAMGTLPGASPAPPAGGRFGLASSDPPPTLRYSPFEPASFAPPSGARPSAQAALDVPHSGASSEPSPPSPVLHSITITVTVPAVPRHSVNQFLLEVEGNLSPCAKEDFIVPVCPQPHVEHPVVALVPGSLDHRSQSVLCFQLHLGTPT